ncbi:MAG: hypothetical protein ACR2IS_07150 [Nitrososphaeraceae archaeon]
MVIKFLNITSQIYEYNGDDSKRGCEALVIQSVVGWSLTAAVLSFQVLTDRNAGRQHGTKT